MRRHGKRKRTLEQQRRRKPQTRTPLRRILVVCEGSVTEPEYLDEFSRVFRDAAVVEVSIDNRAGVPKTLVERAVTMKADAHRAAKRARDPFAQFDDVWCVFDIDNHPRVPEAIQQAAANGIELGISNPCFELWALYHFQDLTTGMARDDLCRRLRDHIPDYEKRLPFDTLAERLEDALARAERQTIRIAELGEPGGNPSTGVPKLLRLIRGG